MEETERGGQLPLVPPPPPPLDPPLRFVSRELQRCPGHLCSGREEGPGQQAWLWVTALPSRDLSREETSVNQLVLDIVETPD